MKPFPVPVIGPGSQESGDEDLQILAMSRDVTAFSMPSVPASASTEGLVAARDLLHAFHRAFLAWSPGDGSQGPRLDLAGVDAAALKVLNEVLGEGEVAIQVGGAQPCRIQESVFAGLWRVCALDASGQVVADGLEAASVPAIARFAARDAAFDRLPPVELPAGAMNSPALIAETRQQLAHAPSRRPDARDQPDAASVERRGPRTSSSARCRSARWR